MKVKKVLLIFSLFIFSFSMGYGQSWLWGRIANSNSKLPYGGEGLSGSIDACGNYYLSGFFYDTLTFGTIRLSTNSLYWAAFVVKYDPNGNVLWANQTTSTNNLSMCSPSVFTTDRFGNYFFGAEVEGNIIYQGKNITDSAGLAIVKCDYNGNVMWVDRPEGFSTGWGFVGSLVTDNKGFLFALGSYSDTLQFGNDTLKEEVRF